MRDWPPRGHRVNSSGSEGQAGVGFWRRRAEARVQSGHKCVHGRLGLPACPVFLPPCSGEKAPQATPRHPAGAPSSRWLFSDLPRPGLLSLAPSRELPWTELSRAGGIISYHTAKGRREAIGSCWKKAYVYGKLCIWRRFSAFQLLF